MALPVRRAALAAMRPPHSEMAGKPRGAAGTLRVRRRRFVGRVIR